MNGIEPRTLPSLLTFIVDNRGRSCPTEAEGFPLIATNCVKDDSLYPVFENVRYVSQATYRDWFRSHPEPGDIVFVCKGSPGRIAMVPDPVPFCIAQDMVALRANSRIVNPHYLYYALKNQEVRARIENMHVGTMIPHFKKGDFGKLHLDVHVRLSDQMAIAEVLGALDDKIAGNSKMASTAGELATECFRDVSIDATFDETTFEKVAAIGGGGTPSTKVPGYWDGPIAWATPTDLTALPGPYLERTARSITLSGLDNCASALFPRGAILMTSRATIGAFAIAQRPVAVNQGFIVVVPEDPQMKWWLFHTMRDRVDEFISHANGATFLELSRGRFRSLPVRVPAGRVLRAFDERVEAIHAVARHALVENTELAELRDTLLPHLMSGRLRVKDAEKQVEAVV
ncbi:restriction endonuclease subunit S [Nakamurella multipartita]|uniref:Restriction modification system DNA specificity domain protein n=1 Tax=Nakamurella multipartita (strain ATCC 700099 / DSM 44233 / CIP 104796 / JCM 9543 / NBRC 105858 / Y-104) TaxID=479431 RepID=C8XCE5_NAKMY|nr:restriction endonuclease subunit S [Nakamurella multipartita]ACV77510.1 restriction modification system DNA specificity domain protein [Nakamurella multipartita DSM 44233]